MELRLARTKVRSFSLAFLTRMVLANPQLMRQASEVYGIDCVLGKRPSADPVAVLRRGETRGFTRCVHDGARTHHGVLDCKRRST